ncbi:MAG: hypothetical protein J3K34DRAFT_470011 [Monoraphidium minutum]|nr:MAG: hypothetical protein J3K34DRAFT_470011 [Monoraphidium minutum]
MARCLAIVGLVLVVAQLAAAANVTAKAAPKPKMGAEGAACAKGNSCTSGLCVAGKCISRQAACVRAAAAPASGCVGNSSAPFALITCNDFTDSVATTLKLAAGLGSTINRRGPGGAGPSKGAGPWGGRGTECYSNGAASCVVLQDSAALANYGAMCAAASGAARAAGAAAATAAAAVAALLLL